MAENRDLRARAHHKAGADPRPGGAAGASQRSGGSEHRPVEATAARRDHPVLRRAETAARLPEWSGGLPDWQRRRHAAEASGEVWFRKLHPNC